MFLQMFYTLYTPNWDWGLDRVGVGSGDKGTSYLTFFINHPTRN